MQNVQYSGGKDGNRVGMFDIGVVETKTIDNSTQFVQNGTNSGNFSLGKTHSFHLFALYTTTWSSFIYRGTVSCTWLDENKINRCPSRIFCIGSTTFIRSLQYSRLEISQRQIEKSYLRPSNWCGTEYHCKWHNLSTTRTRKLIGQGDAGRQLYAGKATSGKGRTGEHHSPSGERLRDISVNRWSGAPNTPSFKTSIDRKLSSGDGTDDDYIEIISIHVRNKQATAEKDKTLNLTVFVWRRKNMHAKQCEVKQTRKEKIRCWIYIFHDYS